MAGLALDKKASDLVLLEMKGIVPYTDYFIICSGESTQQVRSIADNIEEGLKKRKARPLGVEGRGPGRWVLMDYGDVIAHVFERDTRQYYMLDKLWLDAPRIPVEAGVHDESPHNLGGKDKRRLRG